jgi:hypothetical protein
VRAALSSLAGPLVADLLVALTQAWLGGAELAASTP